jgi:hypothetical protein
MTGTLDGILLSRPRPSLFKIAQVRSPFAHFRIWKNGRWLFEQHAVNGAGPGVRPACRAALVKRDGTD